MSRNKRRRKSKYNNSGISEAGVRTFFIRAIAVWLFILPLIVHVKEVPVPVQMQDLYLAEMVVDLFAYYKAVWLWWGAGIFFVSALIFRYKYKLGYRPTKQVWALIAFAVAIILSFIFSEYKNVAWFGYLDRYEGTLSWLSYCMAAYAVHSFVANKEHNTTLVKGIVLSAGVVGLIGAFQFFKMDFFKTEFGKMLMLGKYYATMSSNLNFTMPEGTSYTTLYNPNYVGSFVAVTLPLVFYMISQATNNIWRTIYSVIGISLVISLIGSKSTAGLVAVVIVIIIYAVLFATKIKANKVLKIAVPIALVIAIVIGLSLPFVQRQVSNVKLAFAADPNPNHFKSVVVKDKDVIITTDSDQSFTISPKGDTIEVSDKAGNILSGVLRENDYVIYLPSLSMQSYIKLDNLKGHIDFVYYYSDTKRNLIRFDYFPQLGEFSILKRSIVENNLVRNSKLFGNEKAFSNRGYIWNRSIPQIMNRPILGYGADGFALTYPQIDVLSRWEVMYDHHIIVDKVHNTYLQILVNFGFVGLIAFLGIIFGSFIKAERVFKLVILGFLIVAFINDSITSVTAMIFIVCYMFFDNTKQQGKQSVAEK